MKPMFLPKMDGEEWREMPGWPAYLVSNLGRVWSNRYARLLIPGRRRNGYLFFTLVRDRVHTQMDLHRIVAIAFEGPPPTKAHVVNHKDGIKTDNRLANLEWATAGENRSHAIRTGLQRKPPKICGEKHHLAKLTQNQVLEIRRRYDSGERACHIAAEFGVSDVAICCVGLRKTWKHIEEADNGTNG